MTRYSLVILGLIAALVVLRWPSAGGTELLPNGGFESGTDGWGYTDGTLDTVASPVHGGSSAGRLTGAFLQMHEVYQFAYVQAGGSYTFSSWVYLDDAGVSQAFLKIRWLASNGAQISEEQSVSLTIHKPEFQAITTAQLTAPLGSVRARFGLIVEPNAPFTIYFDDFSLDGPAPTPTPSPTLTPSATPVSPADTPSPMPTDTPTPTPSVTPSGGAATPTATPAASATPGPSVTASPTPTRTPSPTPPRTASATPAPTPTPTPTIPPAFPELTNGSFEVTDVTGPPIGWRKFGGEMTTTELQYTDGVRALEFRSQTSSTKWVYQTVLVTGGQTYRALADALPADGIEAAFLRVSWYGSADGSGSALGSSDSPPADAVAAFTRLDTGPILAPDKAMTARVRLMLRPESDAPATAYFDDVEFGAVPAPTVTMTPSPPASPSATPTTPAASSTLTPTPAPTSTATEAPRPGPTAVVDPMVFPGLTNGGFEQDGADGAPFGWRKVGGEIASVGEPRSEGNSALRLTSATTSTKWAYQTVNVEPGAYYQASAQAFKNDAGAEALFLRLSWYPSEDGEGAAIDSVDSTELLSADSPAFQVLSTGAVLAPSEARSVRVKLMLRPASAAPGAGYFDDVRLSHAEAPPASQPAAATGATPAPALRSNSETEALTATPAVLGVVATPLVPANVRARATPAPVLTAGADDGRDWLTYASMSVAVVALGLAGFSEWRRRTERTGP